MERRSRIETFGLLMWVAVVVLVGGLAVGAVGGDVAEGGKAQLADEEGTLPTDAVESYAEAEWGVPVELAVDTDAPAFDVGFTLPTVGVLLRNVGHPEERQSVVLESGAIEGGPAASAGLCAVGLDGRNPSGVSLNVTAGRVNATIDPDPSGNVSRPSESARDLVARCAEE